jgi:hypothetical protein
MVLPEVGGCDSRGGGLSGASNSVEPGGASGWQSMCMPMSRNSVEYAQGGQAHRCRVSIVV